MKQPINRSRIETLENTEGSYHGLEWEKTFFPRNILRDVAAFIGIIYLFIYL